MTPMIESLESRQLLASVTLSSGVLTIIGNNSADRIEVQKRTDEGRVKVELNGRETKYALSAVTKVVINALGGNDYVEYSGRDGGLVVGGLIDGGDGNDTIQGGPANDTISGGLGNDRIQGKAGDDAIAGNAGHDTIEGADGNDTLKGLAGNDDISGNAGRDRIEGGDGQDDLSGGSSVDSIYGGSGNDDFDNSDVAREKKDLLADDNGANANV